MAARGLGKGLGKGLDALIPPSRLRKRKLLRRRQKRLSRVTKRL